MAGPVTGLQASGTSPLATALTGAGRAAADVPSAVTAARWVPGTPGRTDPAPPGLEPRRLQPKGGAAPGPVRRHCPGSTRRAPEPLCKAAGRGLRYPRQRRGDAGQAGQQRLARRSERRPARGSSSVPPSLPARRLPRRGARAELSAGPRAPLLPTVLLVQHHCPGRRGRPPPLRLLGALPLQPPLRGYGGGEGPLRAGPRSGRCPGRGQRSGRSGAAPGREFGAGLRRARVALGAGELEPG